MNNYAPRRLIVVHGPTASGKTALAIKLAQKLECEILSCDSRQFYREMTIGTAVPSPEELAQAPHHFIHDRSINAPLSAGSYETQALELLDKLLATTNYSVMVGGSGLYAAAVTQGFDDLPHDEQIRLDLNSLQLSDLQEKLKTLDPDFHAVVALDNRRRVQRAVEVCLATGKKYSALRSNSAKQRPFDTLEIAITHPREELYSRIDQRVDVMIEQGLENEAQQLLPFRDVAPLQTVGYREFFDYFEGKQSLDKTIQLIKQNTRHYAKRQMTWIRSRPNITQISPKTTADLTFL